MSEYYSNPAFDITATAGRKITKIEIVADKKPPKIHHKVKPHQLKRGNSTDNKTRGARKNTNLTVPTITHKRKKTLVY